MTRPKTCCVLLPQASLSSQIPRLSAHSLDDTIAQSNLSARVYAAVHAIEPAACADYAETAIKFERDQTRHRRGCVTLHTAYGTEDANLECRCPDRCPRQRDSLIAEIILLLVMDGNPVDYRLRTDQCTGTIRFHGRTWQRAFWGRRG
jgi:hypothetical protein